MGAPGAPQVDAAIECDGPLPAPLREADLPLEGSREEEKTRAPRATRGQRAAFAQLDIDEILSRAVEPYGEVMAALEALPAGGVLIVKAPFRPGLLIELFLDRGHRVQVEVSAEAVWLLEVVVGGEAPYEDLRDLGEIAAAERIVAAREVLSSGESFLARVRGSARAMLRTLRAKGVDVQATERGEQEVLVRLMRL